VIHEAGPFRAVFEWDPHYVGLFFATWSAGLWFLVEAPRSYFDGRRPPWGLAIFRWNTNWLGDLLCLSAMTGAIAVYYQQFGGPQPRAESDEIVWVAVGIATTVSFLFILFEELAGSYAVRADKFNANRLYHLVYFWVMVYLASTALTRFAIIGPGEAQTAVVVAFVAGAGWVATFVADTLGIENFIWLGVKCRYPHQIPRP